MRTLGRRHRPVAAALIVAVLVAMSMPAWADDAMDAKQLVERAKLSFEGMVVAPEMDGLRDLIRTAKGVFIAPQVLRGAFIFGVSGGSGVFFARSELPGKWSGPAFYTIGGVSFGFQAGADASEVALLAMTDRGVNALLSTSVKLGADGASRRVRSASGCAGTADVSANDRRVSRKGPDRGQDGVSCRARRARRGHAAATAAATVSEDRGDVPTTANVSVDLVSFSRAKGLYGGVSLDGAVVATRSALNSAYYGKDASTQDILIRGSVSNPEAAPLIDISSNRPPTPSELKKRHRPTRPQLRGPAGRRLQVVEAVGIEPTSGNPRRQASTSIADYLVLSLPGPPIGRITGRPAPKSLTPHPGAGFGASHQNMMPVPGP